VKKSYNFNWADLDRETLFHVLYSARDKVVDKAIPTPKFHDIITRHIKSYLPIKGCRMYSTKVDFGWVLVGGAYYSDLDEYRKKCIEVNFSYHGKEWDIKISDYRFKRLCLTFADTILHEVIHMRQFRKRKFKHLPDYASTAKREKQRKEQEYLGNNDEIDAYAFNIACEVLDKARGNHKLAVKLLNENQQGLKRKATCWRAYLTAFNHDHNHSVIKHMKKRVVYYLPKAEKGKPFRACDWIDR
jgi:hypothetical protein